MNSLICRLMGQVMYVNSLTNSVKYLSECWSHAVAPGVLIIRHIRPNKFFPCVVILDDPQHQTQEILSSGVFSHES